MFSGISWFVLLLIVAYCDKLCMAIEDNHALEEESVEKTMHLNFTVPKPMTMFMFTKQSFFVDYNIECRSDQKTIVVVVKPMSELITLESNETFHLPCEMQKTGPENVTNGYSSYTVQENEHGEHPYRANGNLSLTLRAGILGIRKLSFQVLENGSQDISQIEWSQAMPVLVLRKMRPLDRIFQTVVGAFIIVITMGFGCKLDLGIVKECVKKPIAPGIGFGCQYLLMPLIGYSIAKALPIDDPNVAFGIFTCATCPGGGASNIYTYLLDGDVSLSITMTFVSTIASIGMMPLWIYTLGKTFLDEDFHIVIPYANMAQVIAMIVVPLLIGIAIKWKSPKAAVFILKLLKPVTVICMFVFMGLGLYSNMYIFQLFQPLYIMAGAMLPYFGYLFGGLVAFLFRLPKDRVITIAIEAGMQNMAIAFMLNILSFPPPQGDIANAAPMASGLMTPIPPFLAFLGLTIYKKCCKKYKPANVEDPEVKVKSIKNGGEKNGTLVTIKSVETEKLSSV